MMDETTKRFVRLLLWCGVEHLLSPSISHTVCYPYHFSAHRQSLSYNSLVCCVRFFFLGWLFVVQSLWCIVGKWSLYSYTTVVLMLPVVMVLYFLSMYIIHIIFYYDNKKYVLYSRMRGRELEIMFIIISHSLLLVFGCFAVFHAISSWHLT